MQDELPANSLTADSLSFENQLPATDMDKLERSASSMSFQQVSLQENSLQAAYSIGNLQSYSLTGMSLSFQDQLSAAYQIDQDKLELEWLKKKTEIFIQLVRNKLWNHLDHLDDSSFP